MSSRERRVRDLEQQLAPVDPGEMTDLDRDWFRGLCASSSAETAWQFAELLAERRYWFEAGDSASNRRRWSGDWRHAVSPAERDARVQAEWDRLARTLKEDGEQGLNAWLASADREGWPSLIGVTFSMDRDGFEAMVNRRRASIDVSRGSDMPGAVFWRRAHPTWRPGMTGAEALVFEVELLQEGEHLREEMSA